MRYFFFIAATLLLFSCKNSGSNGTHGPVVLGNPATIVTETDSQYLTDIVPDLQLPAAGVRPADSGAATPASPAADTATTAPAAANPPAPVPASGFTADFGEVQINLPADAIADAAKSVKGKPAAAFTLAGKSLKSNSLGISGATITRVQQRNTYAVAATHGTTQLLLQVLGIQTGQWRTLRAGGSSYAFAPKENAAFRASGNAIRNAAQQAARAAGMNKNEEAAFLKSLAGARDVNSAPLSTAIKSITWKIDGKTAAGKAFSKELRIDVPL